MSLHHSQMKLVQRLKNIWKLSGYEIQYNLDKKELPAGTKLTMNMAETRKMAQIIRRKTPSQEFLEKNK